MWKGYGLTLSTGRGMLCPTFFWEAVGWATGPLTPLKTALGKLQMTHCIEVACK